MPISYRCFMHTAPGVYVGWIFATRLVVDVVMVDVVVVDVVVVVVVITPRCSVLKTSSVLTL